MRGSPKRVCQVFRRALPSLLALCLAASTALGQTLQDPPPQDPPHTGALMALLETLKTDPQPDELARKARSEAQLRAEGYAVAEGLPVIAGETRSLRRSTEEVVERLLALMMVAIKGETDDQALTDQVVAEYGAADYLSPKERAFIEAPEVRFDDRIDMSWRYEGAYVLLWALGFVDRLGPETEIVDVGTMASLMRDLGAEGLFQEAELRPQGEILDRLDRTYRLHWAVTEARITGQAMGEVIGSVTYERHYALNWLVGYLGQAWDEISTDT